MDHKDAVMLCRIFENLEDVSIETMCALEEMLQETFEEFDWIFNVIEGTWEVFGKD